MYFLSVRVYLIKYLFFIFETDTISHIIIYYLEWFLQRKIELEIERERGGERDRQRDRKGILIRTWHYLRKRFRNEIKCKPIAY